MADKTKEVAKNEESEETLGELLRAKLKGASATEIVNLTQQLVRQDTSSTITERGKGNGFSQLHLSVDRSAGTVKTDNLPALLKLWVKDMPAFVPQEFVTILQQTLEELTVVELDERWAGQKFHIAFAGGQGELIFLYLSLEPSGQEGKVKFTKGKMAGKFALAPDYMVIRHSKSNFFGSKTKDEVVYIPRGVTKADVADLIANIQLPAMNYLEDKVSAATPQLAQ